MKVRSWLALWVTLIAQALITFLLAIAPVVAPAVAPTLGIDPARVGVFTALAYVFAIISGALFGPWINRIGPIRFTCYVLLTGSAGAVIGTAGGAWLLVAAALVGAGYGGTNPSAAAILGRHAPAKSAGFFFALKQTGVPLGVALAGVTMTWAVAAAGWRPAVWTAAAITAVGALVVLRTAPLLEDEEQRRSSRPASAWASIAEVVRRPAVRQLATVSLAYGMAQQAFVTFSVSLLVHAGVSLSTAGLMLAGSQAASVVVRITTGHVSDRLFEPRSMLVALGFLMALACAALAALPTSPPAVLAAIAMAFAGATTMGWNGIFFAQLVRIVPREELAKVSGGTQAFTFGGAVLGPYLFYLLLNAGGSYPVGFLFFGAMAAGAAVLMWRGSSEGRP
jgi:MFS family permease